MIQEKKSKLVGPLQWYHVFIDSGLVELWQKAHPENQQYEASVNLGVELELLIKRQLKDKGIEIKEGQ